MILKYYKKARSVEATQKALRTTLKGTSATSMIRLFRKRGLSVSLRSHAGFTDIYEAINYYNAPMLASLDDGNHWVIIYGYSVSEILVLDPSMKTLICRWEKRFFRQRWDNWGAIIY
jgi:ABC-type bacteriocin/lantibiotic exporter with double-glycine peptidase domain